MNKKTLFLISKNNFKWSVECCVLSTEFEPRVFPNYSRVLSSSETQGQSVGPGEKARRKFSSTGGKPLGTDSHRTVSKRSSECWLLIGHKKCFVLFCPIGEQHLATVARFVHQAFLTRNEGTTDESKNVSDAISRSNSICTEKILFLIVSETYPYPYHNVS